MSKCRQASRYERCFAGALEGSIKIQIKNLAYGIFNQVFEKVKLGVLECMQSILIKMPEFCKL